jgi:branched-chain amino acid transport system permease protein
MPGTGWSPSIPDRHRTPETAISSLIDQFWPATIDGLTLGAIYALIALGYTLVYGVLRLINFAHSEIFLLGTFGAVVAASFLGLHENEATPAFATLVLFLVVGTIFATAFAGSGAVALEFLAYRRLRHRGSSRLAALISAIGASFAMSEFFALRYGREDIQFPRVLEKERLFSVFDASVRADKLLVFVSAVVMMLALDQFVQRTRLGRGIRAVAQDPETATLMGVNIDRVVTLTFLLGGIMAGVAGVLFEIFREATRFNIGFLYGVKAFTAAVLGGIGNIRGALVGGLVLGVVENYGAAIFGNEWRDVIAFVLLVGVLMFRPTGILGESLAQGKA